MNVDIQVLDRRIGIRRRFRFSFAASEGRRMRESVDPALCRRASAQPGGSCGIGGCGVRVALSWLNTCRADRGVPDPLYAREATWQRVVCIHRARMCRYAREPVHGMHIPSSSDPSVQARLRCAAMLWGSGGVTASLPVRVPAPTRGPRGTRMSEGGGDPLVEPPDGGRAASHGTFQPSG